jgi:hypothetical protein
MRELAAPEPPAERRTRDSKFDVRSLP